MLHVLYDGSGWTSISAANKNKKPQNDEAVGWHETLYMVLAIQIRLQLRWAKTHNVQERPYVLVLTFLTRTVAPLKKFVSFLFTAEEVDVCTVDSARGRTAPIVHFLKHRRTCSAASWDQHQGLQNNVSREYVAYSRA